MKKVILAGIFLSVIVFSPFTESQAGRYNSSSGIYLGINLGSPYYDDVWVSGYWEIKPKYKYREWTDRYDRRRYRQRSVWVPGYWERKRDYSVWETGYWEKRYEPRKAYWKQKRWEKRYEPRKAYWKQRRWEKRHRYDRRHSRDYYWW